jgi:O-methyltransferase involved in polyketide biosynthesis
MKKYVKERTEQQEKTDEPWTSRFQPTDIAALLRSHGFANIEDISFQEMTARFGRAIQGLAPGQVGVRVVRAKH